MRVSPDIHPAAKGVFSPAEQAAAIAALHVRIERGTLMSSEALHESVVIDARPILVNTHNFIRAETDMYFRKTVEQGAFGKLKHTREPTAIDAQTVVRMNRDTLYSSGVFDLDAGPVAIALPDVGERYMSMQIVSEDHYTTEVVYGPGRFTYRREQVGTRYMFVIIRTLANPEDGEDIQAAQAAQDEVYVEQEGIGRFETPAWDPVSQARARDALNALSALGGLRDAFGAVDEVDPVDHLVGTAVGWGGNPRKAAIYVGVTPGRNDGRTVHALTVKEVPVDGFWSISVYNARGFFEKNDLGVYSLNNLTAKPSADGSYRIQFGGCGPDVANCLPIQPGWNYTVRLYRPRKEVLGGTWRFPRAAPVQLG